jgi:hypothetical protein
MLASSVHESCGRSSCTHRSLITAVLTPPFEGVSETTIHYPGSFSPPAGERLSVLLDPSEPGYSELPGYRYTSNLVWIFSGGFAVLLVLVGVAKARAWRRMIAGRRGYGQAAAAGA